MQRQVARAVPDDGPGGAARDGRAFVWIALTAFARFALVARGYVGDTHSPEQRGRLPGPVVAGFVLAREKLLGRADGRRADAVAA